MKALLVLALLVTPGASALTWEAPDEGPLDGITVLRVRAPDGAVPAFAVDGDANKANGARMDRISCAAQCLFEGFVDTTAWPDGEHRIHIADLAGSERLSRPFVFDNSATTHDAYLWPDVHNPWVEQVQGPGEVRLLVWLMNTGNAVDNVTLFVQAPWAAEIREVATIQRHGEAGTWQLAPGETRTLNVVLQIPDDGRDGGDIVLVAGGAGDFYMLTHHIDGWRVVKTGNDAPAPGLLLALAALFVVCRRREY